MSRGHGGMAHSPVGSQPPVGPSHCGEDALGARLPAPAELLPSSPGLKTSRNSSRLRFRWLPDFSGPASLPFPRRILLVLGEQTRPRLPAALLAVHLSHPGAVHRVFFPPWMGENSGCRGGWAGSRQHCLRRRQTGSGGGTFPSWKAGSDYVFARSLKITGRSLL